MTHSLNHIFQNTSVAGSYLSLDSVISGSEGQIFFHRETPPIVSRGMVASDIAYRQRLVNWVSDKQVGSFIGYSGIVPEKI